MMVGAAGFEPTTPTPPVWCATRLRYAPPKLPAPPLRQGKPGCHCIAAAPGQGKAHPPTPPPPSVAGYRTWLRSPQPPAPPDRARQVGFRLYSLSNRRRQRPPRQPDACYNRRVVAALSRSRSSLSSSITALISPAASPRDASPAGLAAGTAAAGAGALSCASASLPRPSRNRRCTPLMV